MKNKLLKLVIIAKSTNARYVNSGSQYITLLIVSYLTKMYVLFHEISIWIMEILMIQMLKNI